MGDGRVFVSWRLLGTDHDGVAFHLDRATGDGPPVRLDTAPREVEVPEALARALDADPAARAAFEKLAFTHRKEFARWIDEAKREQTRDRRVAQALDMLRAGETRS